MILLNETCFYMENCPRECFKFIKSVHFKKTVVQFSFSSKLWYFLFWLVLKVPQFERNKNRATLFLKWKDFSTHLSMISFSKYNKEAMDLFIIIHFPQEKFSSSLLLWLFHFISTELFYYAIEVIVVLVCLPAMYSFS